MSDYVIIQKDTLTAMGDAMRGVYDETELYSLDDIIDKIEPIERDYTQDIIAYLEGDTPSVVKIPNGVTCIGYDMFHGNTNITGIILPKSVTRIEGYAFYGCTNLASITFPEKIESIGPCALQGCTNLASITFMGRIKNVGSYAFQGCTNLTSITFLEPPYYNDVFYDNAIWQCDNLKVINVSWSEDEYTGFIPWSNIPVNYNYTNEASVDSCDVLINTNTIKAICNKIRGCNGSTATIGVAEIADKIQTIFAGDTSQVDSFMGTELTNFDVPMGVTKLTDYALYRFKSLKSVTLPDGLVYMGSYVFNSSDIESIIFPESLTYIGDYMFDCFGSRCNSLVLPSNLEYIGYYAFNMNYLTELTFNGTPTHIDDFALLGVGAYVDTLTINVPWSEGEVENIPWGANASSIVINYNYVSTGE